MELPARNPTPAVSERSMLLAAARRCFADRPASEVTVADVASAAGVDEVTLLGVFRSRRGLERAVVEQLAASLDRSSDRMRENGPATFAGLLAERRTDPDGSRLLVRCALGDADIAPLLTVGGYVNSLIRWLEAQRGRRRGAVPLRTRLSAFGAMSTLLGWISFERFVRAAFDLDATGRAPIDAVVAGSAAVVAGVAVADDPVLRRGSQSVARSDAAHSMLPGDDGFFPSDALGWTLDDAARLFDATFDGAHWYDLAEMVRIVRHASPVARHLAAAAADDVPVDSYRAAFPALTAALGAFAARDDLRPEVADGDHRVALAVGSAMVLGSTLWDRPLRLVTGIAPDVDVDPAIVTFLRLLAGFPDPSGPLDRA
jgi:AcrR family transcriptional regulator